VEERSLSLQRQFNRYAPIQLGADVWFPLPSISFFIQEINYGGNPIDFNLLFKEYPFKNRRKL